MIIQSDPLMTFIDLFVVGVAIYLIAPYPHHRRAIHSMGLSTSLRITLCGVLFVATLYVVDLYSMYVMPRLDGPEAAMRFMMSLHLQWSWLTTLLSIAAIAVGLHGLVGGLVPRFAATLDRLHDTERALRRSQADLEREMASRTARLTLTETRFNPGHPDRLHRARHHHEIAQRERVREAERCLALALARTIVEAVRQLGMFWTLLNEPPPAQRGPPA